MNHTAPTRDINDCLRKLNIQMGNELDKVTDDEMATEVEENFIENLPDDIETVHFVVLDSI